MIHYVHITHACTYIEWHVYIFDSMRGLNYYVLLIIEMHRVAAQHSVTTSTLNFTKMYLCE